jgi:anthranilate synthase/aminodeoxychorismate synthase-like glutamine amidotransferase
MKKSAPKILVIDNYDSFVYNLVQYLGELGAEPIVVRNDEVTIQQALELNPDGVLLSPGPGRPQDAGILCEAVSAFAKTTPIFGVCLGHQAIGHVFGANIISAPELQHGKTSQIHHKNLGVFAGLDSPITATRYHSLAIDPESVPKELEVTATTDDGLIMGVRHKNFDVEGVQFHPESILTDHGYEIIKTFLVRCEKQKHN